MRRTEPVPPGRHEQSARNPTARGAQPHRSAVVAGAAYDPRMIVFTEFSQARWGDPDVEVRVVHDGHSCVGFIDARRRRDDSWEALVRFTHRRDGYPHTRRDWFSFADLDLVDTASAPRPGVPGIRDDLDLMPPK